ncbi:hypothetical protein CRG98_041814 [Punica granatum]|uniref:Reverse transcriptase Ty1/copia-type domain-containing protein n=1 Tax=Punica granatum TaxID=22663 RepID=A0A2I0I1V5_PUNGR|nr:hypothetical protein CRG98_041814 [Punica granatum]
MWKENITTLSTWLDHSFFKPSFLLALGANAFLPRHTESISHQHRLYRLSFEPPPPFILPAPSSCSSKSASLEQLFSYSKFTSRHLAFTAVLDSDVEPRSYKEAFQDPHWRATMNEETWTIEPIPPDKEPTRCKWVFKIKRNADGSVERLKASLAAKGFTQVEWINFTETFAPVAKLVTVRNVACSVLDLLHFPWNNITDYLRIRVLHCLILADIAVSLVASST